MIRTIKVELNAAFPQMPLIPFQVYHNSAAAVTVLNVPRRIVSLSFMVKNVSGTDGVFAAQRQGSAWIAVIPGDFLAQSGTSTKGVKIIGVDEQANAFTLGAADLLVLLDDGTVQPVQPPIVDVAGKLPLKPLPKYLHYLPFDDTYPADAAWLYAQLGPSDLGRCSAVRRGGKLWRNYDWTFDSAAEFVVRVSGNADARFASVGVASVGSRLTENDVMSAVNSRYYKCLPGMTLDGINEKGVVCEINVDGGPKDGWHGDGANALHILAAVRWVLDHGETAQQAAAYIADHIIQPSGEMNFHFMVADATSTYIVENGSAHDVTDGVKVLTNYALYAEAHAGGGKERYQLLADGADISAVLWTKAYAEGNTWHSDFESEAQHLSAISQWAAQGTDKEAHRGKTSASGKAWWQSVHTTEYDFAAKTMRVAVQEQDDWYVFAVDAVPPSVTLDDTVTQSSANGVKSSGIWSWVKGLLPSWLTPKREEPPSQASVNAIIQELEKKIPYDKWGGISMREYNFKEDGVDRGSLSTGGVFLKDEYGNVKATVGWPEGEGTFALRSQIPSLAAPSATATGAQAAAAKDTYDFVNSSVNAMAAFFLAKDDGTSFATRAELAACTSFLRNGLTGQKPTQNDYTIVVNDETNPIYQAGVFAVYSKWTATDDYVGYWVDFGGAKTLVTSANKDSLGIVVGGNSPTVPYTRIVPTSRYSYQGVWETAGANGWRFQYSINTSGFTAAQLAALNSGASAELFAQIAAALATIPTAAQKSAWDAKADRASIAPEYSASSAYTVGQFVYHDGNIYQCVSATTGAWDSTKWALRKVDDFFKESNTLLMQTMAIPFASLPADNTTSSYKRFRVTVTDDMTIILHTPTSGDAEIFECRFDGSGLAADKSISFSTSGATATTMDTDCGTVKAGKVSLMSAFWNGATWDVNWKVEG